MRLVIIPDWPRIGDMNAAGSRCLIVAAVAFVVTGIAASGQSTDAGYQSLIRLFSDFVTFERQPLKNGAPDYSTATTAAKIWLTTRLP